MTLWWIGNVVLLVVVVPGRRLPAPRRARAPPGASSRACGRSPTVAAAGSKDLDATALLLTTQDQVQQTVAGVADYGGSLDVILDDAE